MAVTTSELPPVIRWRAPHAQQQRFIDSCAKRKVVRAGRRGGKTVGVAILAVRAFQSGKRVLYAVPTEEQVERFWFECKRALEQPLDAGIYYKNETKHVIELPGTEQRIRAKTAWNADTLRGDYADLLILDEWQLMNEDAWELVGAPMLLDNNGDAVFVYTPPSIRSIGMSKAKDKQHAGKMYKKALADTTGRWEAFHFSSHDNPHISETALSEITSDMSSLAYDQEIMANDRENVPGALWTQTGIDDDRVAVCPELVRIVIPIDPSASSARDSDECGIIPVGKGWCSCRGKPELHAFVLEDLTKVCTPEVWGNIAVDAYLRWKADRILGEGNNGGEMVETIIKYVVKERNERKIDSQPKLVVPYKMVWASRGKATRAEPVSTLYEQHKVHHVGNLPKLEGEQCSWVPGEGRSPNRVDSLVWGITELGLITSHDPIR